MLTIVITGTDGASRRHRFDKPCVAIGREAGNDIVLTSDTVSRHHARIERKDGKFILADRNSTNGVFVNSRRIRGAVLVSSRDVIELGGFTLRVLMPVLTVDLPEAPPAP